MHVDVCECAHLCVFVGLCVCVLCTYKVHKGSSHAWAPGDPAPPCHRGEAQMSPGLMSAVDRCSCARVWVDIRLFCGAGDHKEQVTAP